MANLLFNIIGKFAELPIIEIYCTEICFANFAHEQRRGLQNVLISTKVINVRFCSLFFYIFLDRKFTKINSAQ